MYLISADRNFTSEEIKCLLRDSASYRSEKRHQDANQFTANDRLTGDLHSGVVGGIVREEALQERANDHAQTGLHSQLSPSITTVPKARYPSARSASREDHQRMPTSTVPSEGDIGTKLYMSTQNSGRENLTFFTSNREKQSMRIEKLSADRSRQDSSDAWVRIGMTNIIDISTL